MGSVKQLPSFNKAQTSFLQIPWRAGQAHPRKLPMLQLSNSLRQELGLDRDARPALGPLLRLQGLGNI